MRIFYCIFDIDFLRLENNSFTGDVDGIFCNSNETSFGFLDVSADCGGANPELVCTCCAECCQDELGCPFDTPLESCLRLREQLLGDPYCDCVAIGGDSLIEGRSNPDVEYFALTCLAPFYQVCSEDRTTCALLGYGYLFDDFGEIDSQFFQHEYIRGVHEGRVVRSLVSFSNTKCEVMMDGQLCSVCRIVFCLDGYYTKEVRCNNVEEGASFNGCISFDDNFESFGALQVLDPQYDGSNFIIYNAGYCQVLAPFMESGAFREEEVAICRCDDSGLGMPCTVQNCVYCLGGEDEQLPRYCYLFRFASHFLEFTSDVEKVVIDYLVIPSFSSANNITSDTTNTNMTADAILISYEQSQIDDSCTVSIDGERCNSCNLTVCPGTGGVSDDSKKFQVNCENLLGTDAKFDRCKNETGPGILRLITEERPQCSPYNVTTSPYQYSF